MRLHPPSKAVMKIEKGCFPFVFPIKKHADIRALLRECEVQKDDEAQNDSVGTEDSEVPLSDVVHEFLNDHHGYDEAYHGAQKD